MTPATTTSIYQSLISICESELDNRDKLLGLSQIFREVLKHLTETELQFFTGEFAQWSFLCDKFNVPQNISSEINGFRRFSAHIAKNSTATCSNTDILACTKAITTSVSFFSSIPIPSNLSDLWINNPDLSVQFARKRPADTVPSVRAVVLSIGNAELQNDRKQLIIQCESDELGRIKIAFYDRYLELESLLWVGAIIHCTDMVGSKVSQNSFYTTGSTLVILEPDILIDVTDVAECFQSNGINPMLYFLKKFSPGTTSLAALAGTLVNSCFDELLHNYECNFDEIFDAALRVKPLQVIHAVGNSPDAVNELRGMVRQQFENLRALLPTLQYDIFSVEPTFLSPMYGLQGRLDLLLEYADVHRKTVIELKSGRAPLPTASFGFADKHTIKTGMWINHLIQTTCYNLLLDSAFPGRTGDSQVLYSRTIDYPLRNAPNIPQNKRDSLMLRNTIISMEHQIIERQFSLLRKITPESFGPKPDFKQSEIVEFSHFYSSLTPTERTYFQAFYSFLLREQYASRTGSEGRGGQSGFAALWRDSLAEKEANFSVLSHLELLPDESDFTNFYLMFRRTELTAQVSSFRIGDIAILYSLNEQGEARPVEGQIIKASVRNITTDRIAISLRNKQLNAEFFTTDKSWILEPDQIESGYNALYRALMTALKTPERKRNILLGLQAPSFGTLPEVNFPGLHPEQKLLLARAISSEDYFLLQGPPGTGKTSVMLRSLVEFLHDSTEETLLVLAFTNRAVDEICTALKKIRPDFPFIRLGSKETSEHPDRLLSSIAQDKTIEELAQIVKHTRIIVSTVSSVNANPEILHIKQFTTAIIDEASQLLEPQIIGILAVVDRFILIGDEKQLPAVVVQNERGAIVNSPHLEQIHLTDLRISLFERLIRICTQNGWIQGVGMLVRQARMHNSIQNFANKFFYDSKLEPMNPWQSEVFSTGNMFPTAHIPNHSLRSPLPSKLSEEIFRKQLIYLSSEREHRPKVHYGEAQQAAELITTIAEIYGDKFTNQTVGIITPFRAQIAEIVRHTDSQLRSKVTIDTVERFQGSERDIIILSCAVNHIAQLQSIQSLVTINGVLIDRKLNVALTRARRQFILLGCEEILRESMLYRELIEHIRANV
ncbi:MAG: AAA family ATPase [Ignavibacteria bacterium]|nr:AAA family ATPase [Ignavibacteria bacterium]